MLRFEEQEEAGPEDCSTEEASDSVYVCVFLPYLYYFVYNKKISILYWTSKITSTTSTLAHLRRNRYDRLNFI